MNQITPPQKKFSQCSSSNAKRLFFLLSFYSCSKYFRYPFLLFSVFRKKRKTNPVSLLKMSKVVSFYPTKMRYIHMVRSYTRKVLSFCRKGRRLELNKAY